MRRWNLQDAKNRLSELVREVRAHGAQKIAVHGRDVVVVVPVEEYERLTGGNMNLIDALRRSPLADALAAGELDLDRDRDRGRDLAL